MIQEFEYEITDAVKEENTLKPLNKQCLYLGRGSCDSK
jgi:hypothetical protein